MGFTMAFPHICIPTPHSKSPPSPLAPLTSPFLHTYLLPNFCVHTVHSNSLYVMELTCSFRQLHLSLRAEHPHLTVAQEVHLLAAL